MRQCHVKHYFEPMWFGTYGLTGLRTYVALTCWTSKLPFISHYYEHLLTMGRVLPAIKQRGTGCPYPGGLPHQRTSKTYRFRVGIWRAAGGMVLTVLSLTGHRMYLFWRIMKMNTPLPKKKEKIARATLTPCLAIPEDMRLFTYFCLSKNSFQMELFGRENVKPILRHMILR